MLGRPSRPKDRTQPTKLEITFGHAFDRRRYRRPKALCARASRPSRSAIEERAILGVLAGVGRHEGALRDHPFSIASQRFENDIFRHLVTRQFEHVADRSIDLHALRLLWRLLEEAAAHEPDRSRHWLDKRPSRCNRALVVPRLGPAADAPERAERPER